MSALAVLIVSFNISPTLKEPGSPPKLRVTMNNGSDQPLEFMRFASDACFAHMLLELPLTLPEQVRAEGKRPHEEVRAEGKRPHEEQKAQPAGCPIRSWPGTKGTLAAGAEETRDLDLAQIFPSVKWGRGRYGLHASWNPKELAAYFGGKFSPGASQTSINVEEFELVP